MRGRDDERTRGRGVRDGIGGRREEGRGKI
jgi:hypothetical protein